MKTDFLIVGQGLAGSLLSYELIRSGKSIYVLDNPSSPKASDVAAGVVNPVVFRRMTKSWLIDDLYPRLLKTYSSLENFLSVKLFYPIPIKKVLGKGETDFWQKKYTENSLQNYINYETDNKEYDAIQAEFGMGTVHTGGRVDVKLLVKKMYEYLSVHQLIRNEKFYFQKLTLHNKGIKYKEIEAEKIIFCEGHAVSENPFFRGIQFKHTKGEVLRLQTETYNQNFILNKAMFLMPEGNHYFRLGATYDWDNLNYTPTEEAREILLSKLSNVFIGQHRIVDQQAGIRPTTHDRRPVIGLHPKKDQIGILNGLGSKGTMLGPYFSHQFCQLLTGKITQLHPEVDIKRYYRSD